MRALENRDRVDDPRADMVWMPLNMMPVGEGGAAGAAEGDEGKGGSAIKPEGLRPIRCQSCGKLICEADGTLLFRCTRCHRWNEANQRYRLWRADEQPWQNLE